MLVTQGTSRGQTMLGVYEIGGDRMRICLAAPGLARPRDFATEPGSGHTLQELKRASAAAEPPAKPVGDVTPLVGEWRYRAMTVNGTATDPKAVKSYRLVVGKDGSFAIYDGENQVVAGRVTRVDGSKAPNQIDCVTAGRSEFSGRFEPEVPQVGIFGVEKGTLKLCLTRYAKGPAGRRRSPRRRVRD